MTSDRRRSDADRPYSPADAELVGHAWHGDDVPLSLMDIERGSWVLDALTVAGRLARSRYAGEGEARCGEPHPDGGPPCQMRPGHDTHTRPASGGSDLWGRETDA